MSRTQVWQLVLGVLIGALTGLVLFAVTRASGLVLFVLTGAGAGTLTVVVMLIGGRGARLTEVKLSVPKVSELTFVVNDDARLVAWKLFVETSTRISTQPLDDEEGLVREAMNSLHGLFATTREILKSSRPSVSAPSGQTVEHLAITMLNRELRPFLSAWHPRLRDHELAHPDGPESAWPDRAACRAALAVLQAEVREYALGFAKLAGVRDAARIIEG